MSTIGYFESNNQLNSPTWNSTGSHGSFTTLQGVKIVYLSGSFEPDIYHNNEQVGPFDLNYPRSHITSLLPPPPNPDAVIPPKALPTTDILLTHEYPQGITKLSAIGAAKFAEVKGAPERLKLQHGVRPVSELVTAIQPRYHFASGPGVFFEREPYMNKVGADHVTRFLGLGDYGNPNKERVSHHYFNWLGL
jgi:hypothetical protein